MRVMRFQVPGIGAVRIEGGRRHPLKEKDPSSLTLQHRVNLVREMGTGPVPGHTAKPGERRLDVIWAEVHEDVPLHGHPQVEVFLFPTPLAMQVGSETRVRRVAWVPPGTQHMIARAPGQDPLRMLVLKVDVPQFPEGIADLARDIDDLELPPLVGGIIGPLVEAGKSGLTRLRSHFRGLGPLGMSNSAAV